jgi:secreted PhoX family phosphatase
VVEIDPMDPTSTPVKRTALGRAAHEGAWVAVTKDGRAVVYSGEDARFEYIYKFVSRDRIAARRRGQATPRCWTTARCTWRASTPTARGRWLPLVHGQGPLTAGQRLCRPGRGVIKARQAADLLGATKMDRPEWLAIDPRSREVYCTLTNNRPRRRPASRPRRRQPARQQRMGQIIRWKDDGDFDGTSFRWNHLVLAGDPAQARAEAKGNIKGDIFACPDGLAFDPRGRAVDPDRHPRLADEQGRATRNIGNNQMLACDVASGEIRASSPARWAARSPARPSRPTAARCSSTCSTRANAERPQRPGAAAPAFPTGPTGPGATRPRSATVVIRKGTSGGRSLGSITCAGAITVSQWQMFSSWRTLPGNAESCPAAQRQRRRCAWAPHPAAWRFAAGSAASAWARLRAARAAAAGAGGSR